MLKVTPTELPEVLILEPQVFGDERGWFMESFNQREFDEAVGQHVTFVQDNHSCSRLGVLRGLHYQIAPHAQGKLVRVVRGSAFDVAVDIRRGSRTLGYWVGVKLSDADHRQLWIPPGFAHGFLALEDETHFLYKTTTVYERASERSIAWNDSSIRIDWPLQRLAGPPRLADKDARAPSLADADLM